MEYHHINSPGSQPRVSNIKLVKDPDWKSSGGTEFPQFTSLPPGVQAVVVALLDGYTAKEFLFVAKGAENIVAMGRGRVVRQDLEFGNFVRGLKPIPSVHVNLLRLYIDSFGPKTVGVLNVTRYIYSYYIDYNRGRNPYHLNDLSEALEELVNLKCLDIEDMGPVIAEEKALTTIGRHSNLRFLRLRSCILGDEGIRLFAVPGSKLTHLELGTSSELSDVGLKTIAKNCHGLTHLGFGLANTSRTAEGLWVLSTTNLPNLTSLGLHGSSQDYAADFEVLGESCLKLTCLTIEDAGYKYGGIVRGPHFLEIFGQRNGNLRALTLRNSDRHGCRFEAIKRYFTKLVALRIDGFCAEKKRAIELLEACPGLNLIQFGSGFATTPDAVRQLIEEHMLKKRPNIRFVGGEVTKEWWGNEVRQALNRDMRDVGRIGEASDISDMKKVE